MKKFIYNKMKIFYAFLLLFVVSCNEDTSTVTGVDQLFRPVMFTAGINGNKITFSWVPIANASYSLEISKDSLLFQNDLQVFSLDGVSTFTVDNLWSQSRYSARIKAVSKDSTIKDSEYKKITFITGTENIFYSVASSDISSHSVLLKWDKTKNVSKIVVSTVGTADVIISLSASDREAGQKLIENLLSGTNYIFKIYLEDMLRGNLAVKTLA
ncbi:MAG: hypothetical protein PHT07_24200 [Paludibacter sp.]|nr:hypothetical protein [Paludibacter sp.]